MDDSKDSLEATTHSEFCDCEQCQEYWNNSEDTEEVPSIIIRDWNEFEDVSDIINFV